MTQIVIVDYQLGNLHSVLHACKNVGLTPNISEDPKELARADALILPGVGAFGDAMRNLTRLGLDDAIRAHVELGKPLLGICLGMQLLFEGSEEFGVYAGLGLLPGRVVRFASEKFDGKRLKVPHVGWNTIEPSETSMWNSSALRKIPASSYVYFVHSYFAIPNERSQVLTYTTYGATRFCSSVRWKNIFACQFHPEKSGKIGLSIYRQWTESIQNS